MPTKGILKGHKISNKHQTVIAEAESVIREAKVLDEVTKIVVGHISRVSGGTPRVKYTNIEAGLSVLVRGKSSVQRLYIYTKEPHKVQEVLNDDN